MFRGHNILEYKSPESSLSIGDWKKVYAYAWFYAYFNDVPEHDLTITFVVTIYPRKLLKHFQEKLGCSINEKTAGIYNVSGLLLPAQIIESKKLSEQENLWLKNLRQEISQENMIAILDAAKSRNQNSELGSYMDALIFANFNVLKEVQKVYPMTNELREAFKGSSWIEPWFTEGLEQGIEQGIKQGREEERELFVSNALRKEMKIEDVMELTGLSRQRIEAIAKSLAN
jgi:hypothetical protein